MNKGYKKIAIMGLILANLFGVSKVSALENNNSTNFNLESIKIEEQDRDEAANRMLKDQNYDINITVEKEIVDEKTLMIIETIEYKPKTSQYAISNGTNFGSYATAKFYDMRFSHYQGTVNVDAQGKKISSTSAKINYIRTTQSGFNNVSKGVKRVWGVGTTGNPAKGGVEAEFTYYAPDEWGSYKTEGRFIFVEAYPSGNLKIKTPRF